jgi:hypothetical protein
MADEMDVLLESYHSNTLWEMARVGGLRVHDARGKRLGKKELLSQMRAQLFTPERVRAAWEKLDKRERAVLNRLLLHPEPVRTAAFCREVVRAGLATEAQQEVGAWYHPSVPYATGHVGNPLNARSTIAEDIIARLTYHGLVFSKDAPLSGMQPYKIQFHPAPTLFVPAVVRQALPAPEPLPPAPAQGSWQPERVEGGSLDLLLRDLYLYWDYVRFHEVELLLSGLVGKRALKAINAVLLAPDPLMEKAKGEDDAGRLYFLRLLLEKLGLVRNAVGRLQVGDGDPRKVPAFWGLPPDAQARACVEAWRDLPMAHSLGPDTADLIPRYVHARQVLLTVLAALKPDAWIEVEELLDRLLAVDEEFLFTERVKIANVRGGWYYMGYRSMSREQALNRVAALEHRFVEQCLAGFLREVGAVELGYVGKTLRAFRLRDGGKRLPAMGGESDQSQPAVESQSAGGSGVAAPVGRVVVQPNFQVLAIGPVGLDVLAQLDLFAAREQADAGAFTYRLSRDSLYRAQLLGTAVGEVVELLERASGTALPQNIRRSLDEWSAQHERIVFRRDVTLLEAATPDLLARLRADRGTGGKLARAVSPTVALLKRGRQQALVEALVERGLFPAVSDARPEGADHSVVVAADGTIRPVHAVPSLLLRGRLARLAEEDGAGVWRLTAEVVQRMGGSAKRVQGFLEELARLHRGRLPKEVVERVKAWGGYYGRATVAQLTLLEFRDTAALEELRKDPVLRERLTPFPAGDRALAVVQEEHLEQIRAVLARLGVEVEG